MPAMADTTLLACLFTVPLLWVVLSLLWRGCASALLTAVGVLLELTFSLQLWLRTRASGAFIMELGGWAEPLGIAWRVDGMAVTFIMLTAVVAAACTMHAHLYLAGKPGLQRYFWPLLWFLWAGLNGIWLSADLFNLYVCLELVSLSAVGLVAITGEANAVSAALRYLLSALAGSMSYLLGVTLLYGAHGTLSLPQIAGQIQAGASVSAAMALMLAGLLFKTALFPLHAWLPPAHGGALSPVSALLSALVIKASFYIALRLWQALGDTFDTLGLVGIGLGLLGTGAIFWGSWKALHETALKMVVAYSTVAQIGYLFLFFPLVVGMDGQATQLALEGTILLVASHALAKSAMFLAAGNLIIMIGQDRIDLLTGISRNPPLSLFSFGLASVTLMGLPPSGGFTAKWLLLQSALTSDRWPWIAVLLFGGLATAAYIFRIFRLSFLKGSRETPFHPLSPWLEVAPMLLAVAALLLGMGASGPLDMLAVTIAESEVAP